MLQIQEEEEKKVGEKEEEKTEKKLEFEEEKAEPEDEKVIDLSTDTVLV